MGDRTENRWDWKPFIPPENQFEQLYMKSLFCPPTNNTSASGQPRRRDDYRFLGSGRFDVSRPRGCEGVVLVCFSDRCGRVTCTGGVGAEGLMTGISLLGVGVGVETFGRGVWIIFLLPDGVDIVEVVRPES